MTLKGQAEEVIEEQVGCGRFQVLVVLLVFIPLRVSSVFTFMFMSYGNYNPGWRCLDNYTTLDQGYFNDTSRHNQSSETQPNTSVVEYIKDLTCEEFEGCGRVEFNPESSTVVTEWGLVCNRAWISSLLISVQMIGNLISSFFAGYIADRLGRWKTLYGSLFVTSLLHLLSSYSISWQMLAACRFCVGFFSSFFESLIYVYPSEFLTRSWRGPLAGIPGWGMGGIIFGVTSMLLKDWRQILIASSVVCMLSFLPLFWVPESLRWLEVKGSRKEFESAAKKMARCNKKELCLQRVEAISLNDNKRSATETQNKQKQYTVLDIFHTGYKIITLIVGFVWLSLSFISYAISFGIKAVSGDFYINLIMLFAILIPFAIFPFFAPNLLGRRKSSCIFMLVVSTALFSATAFERATTGSVRIIGTLVLVLIAVVGLESTWSTQQAHVSEIYPTVVRGVAANWASLFARVGGICAPFLIPKDSSSVYLWYLIMACQGLLCCGVLARLPETKGKALKETFSSVTVASVTTGDDFLHRVEGEAVNDRKGDRENDAG